MDFDLYAIWAQWNLAIIGFLALVVLAYWYFKVHKKHNSNEPPTTWDEVDKSGLVHVTEVEKEFEGATLFKAERANGEFENRQIGQPFTFFMQDESIERHHINMRGSYRCVDPRKLFVSYVPSLRELNQFAALTEQHIKELRTGGYVDKARRHLRTFILIFILAGMIGLGLAALVLSGVHH